MDINKQIETLSALHNDKVEIFMGDDGYTKLVEKWSTIAVSPIKQIINAQQVKEFHDLNAGGIKTVVTNRVEKGLEFKNLIMFADRNLEIEKSNPKTLKESRFMPESFKFNGVILIFGDYVGITNLNFTDNIGVIIHDEFLTRSFESMFDALWMQGVQV